MRVAIVRHYISHILSPTRQLYRFSTGFPDQFVSILLTVKKLSDIIENYLINGRVKKVVKWKE